MNSIQENKGLAALIKISELFESETSRALFKRELLEQGLLTAFASGIKRNGQETYDISLVENFRDVLVCQVVFRVGTSSVGLPELGSKENDLILSGLVQCDRQTLSEFLAVQLKNAY